MDPVTKVQTEFSAPEVRSKSGIDLEKVIAEAPYACDLYAIGAVTKFLLSGYSEYSADDLEDFASPQMRDFLRKVESENPFERAAVGVLLRLPVFDRVRLANQEKDKEMQAQRN